MRLISVAVSFGLASDARAESVGNESRERERRILINLKKRVSDLENIVVAKPH
jgi:hypothetical protein